MDIGDFEIFDDRRQTHWPKSLLTIGKVLFTVAVLLIVPLVVTGIAHLLQPFLQWDLVDVYAYSQIAWSGWAATMFKCIKVL